MENITNNEEKTFSPNMAMHNQVVEYYTEFYKRITFNYISKAILYLVVVIVAFAIFVNFILKPNSRKQGINKNSEVTVSEEAGNVQETAQHTDNADKAIIINPVWIFVFIFVCLFLMNEVLIIRCNSVLKLIKNRQYKLIRVRKVGSSWSSTRHSWSSTRHCYELAFKCDDGSDVYVKYVKLFNELFGEKTDLYAVCIFGKKGGMLSAERDVIGF